MPTYPIDIDPEQIVRWLVAEHKATPSALKINVRRVIDVREVPAEPRFHLGDEEREDLNEVETTATLEVAPAHASDGWLLKVIVSDEAGPRILDRESSVGTEQQIDLGTFYQQFIKPGRGIATTSAEVKNRAAEQRLEEFLNSISTDRHPAA